MELKVIKNHTYRIGNIESVDYSHGFTHIMGWATNADNTKSADIVVLIDEKRNIHGIGELIYDRPDVVSEFHNENLSKSGWKIIIPYHIKKFQVLSCQFAEKTGIIINCGKRFELREKIIHVNISDLIFNDISQEYQNIDDERWYQLILASLNGKYIGKCKFPGFASDIIQQNYTGRSGKATLNQAFEFYKEVKNILRTNNISINSSTIICDFGCGWGRISRFFLKDIPEKNIFGLDCTSEAVEICKETYNLGQFYEIPYEPPYNVIKDNTFDVIFAFSIFSHLNKTPALKIIQEYHRILKPGGIFIITSRGEMFMRHCENLRKNNPKDLNSYSLQLTKCFSELNDNIKRYNNGEFLFYGSGGGGILPDLIYGEAAMPPNFIAESFPEKFIQIYYSKEQPGRDLDQTIMAYKVIK